MTLTFTMALPSETRRGKFDVLVEGYTVDDDDLVDLRFEVDLR